MKNHKDIYTLIDEYVPYFNSYFKDMNTHFRDMESGSLLSKSVLLAHILYYRMNGERHQELYFNLQKYIFREQRMMLSGTH